MTWRAKILGQFTPDPDRVTIATDPDGLLLDELVTEDLHARGLEVITYADPIAFRFEYESKYRARWDRGETTDTSVIIRVDFDDYRLLPYDLLHVGRHVSLSLADLFPRLNYHVIASLDRSYLDVLYAQQEQDKPDNLGENESKDFVLRHAFSIAAELIKTPSDLLLVLLRIHYINISLPPTLQNRLTDLLNRRETFHLWPLERLISSRPAFFDFLQERWPVFLERTVRGKVDGSTDIAAAGEEADSYDFQLTGPIYLPFDHPEVRVYMDNLFSEGLLRQVEFDQVQSLAAQWIAVGIKTDPDKDRHRRLESLLKIIEESLPGDDARHRDWMAFARRWAELSALNFEGHNTYQDDADTRRKQLQINVDLAFTGWVRNRYAGLYSQASLTPVMLHHVPRMLARRREQSPDCKIALVVMDGLALDQWIIMRDEIKSQRPQWTFQEEEVFAWVPTLTSVSRQAIFAGKPPLYFHDSLNTTGKEPTLWKQFWGEHGLSPSAVAYSKIVGDPADIPKIEEAITHPHVRVAGIVIAKVDRIMHGEQLGMKGMHDHVRLWAKGGFITELLDLLLDQGFDICITADHGNIEAIGVGSPAEGALAGYRGERVRIFNDHTLRKRIMDNYVDAVEWPAIGLPDTYFPLLAPIRASFVAPGEERIVHGGIAIEELIVPLIYVTQKGQ